MLRAVAFLSIAFATSAVAGQRTLVPEAIRGQEVVWESGLPFAVSRTERATIAISPTDVDKRRASITVTVINHAESAVTLYDSAVIVHAQGGKSMRVYGAADLEAREKRRRFWENVGVGLVAAADAYAAGQSGYSSSASHHSGTVHGYGSSGYVRGTYSGTTVTHSYDHAAAQRAQADAAARTQSLASQVQAEQHARMSSLQAGVLRTHTLAAGGSHSGRLEIELPRKQRSATAMSLTVNFAGEQHEFILFVDGQPSSEQRMALQRAFPAPTLVVSRDTSEAPAQLVATSVAIPVPPDSAGTSEPTPEAAWAMPLINAVRFGTEGLDSVVHLSVTFSTSGSTALDGRLVIGDRESSRLSIPVPLSASQVAERRFSEVITIPVADLPPGSEQWLRSTPIAKVHAAYRSGE